MPVYLPHDANGPSAVYRYFEARGFNVMHAYQNHEDSVLWMTNALHERRVAISTPRLWRGLSGLRFPSDGEHSDKLWMNTQDDEWDCFRYALSEPISTSDILPGVDRAKAGYSMGVG